MKSKLRSLGIKKQERLLSVLRAALDSAHMEDAHFGSHTKLIKDETRLYRQSWLIAPLETAIKIIESNGEAVKPAEDSSEE